MPPPPRLETLCAQAREDLPSANRPLVTPIYQSAVWALASAEECDAVYEGEAAGFIYTRDANPNHAALERVLATLEGAEEAVLFSSGMAAIAGTLTALAGQGARIVAAAQIYGATSRLLAGELSRFGIETAWVNGSDTEAIRRALEPGARLLLVEAIGNPLMQVPDLPRLAALCRDAGALLVVDATFASPYCCRPLQHGAGVVLHSVTKFLAGHSDVTLGVAAGSAAVATELRRQARLFGGSANPFESWLALRGLTTFPLRMGRCCANAAELARRLAAHPKVRAVHYPGLAGSGRSAAPKGVLTDPGAMLSFELEGGDAARAFLRCLQYVRFAPSLGDVATTVSYPIATSHRGLPCGTLGELGISAGLVRLSAGIDHVDDVWSDLEQALAASG